MTQAVAEAFRTLWKRVAPRTAKDDSPVRIGPNGTFVFIHINKNAGTSIGHAIGLPKKQHLTVQEVIEIVGRAQWERAFRFSIVRNPWDKVVSHYNHRVKTNQTGLNDNPLPFKQWVAATYGPAKDARYYDQPKMFQPQVEWLKDDLGQGRAGLHRAVRRPGQYLPADRRPDRGDGRAAPPEQERAERLPQIL